MSTYNDITNRVKSDLTAWNKWVERLDELHNFIDVDLSNSNCDGINFGLADWVSAKLDHGSFRNAIGHATDFTRANAAGADFSRSRFAEKWSYGFTDGRFLMRNTSFASADLSGAIFDQSDLRQTYFGKADLTGARFVGADLRHSCFVGAKLNDAIFDDAALEGALFDSTVPAELTNRAKDVAPVDISNISLTNIAKLRTGISRLRKIRLLVERSKSKLRSSSDEEIERVALQINEQLAQLLLYLYGAAAGVAKWIEENAVDFGPRIKGPNLWEFSRRDAIERSWGRIPRSVQSLRGEIENRVRYLEEQNESVRLMGEAIFIVHGHDEGARESVARFIEKIGLRAVILHERPNKGRTIITKFREEVEEIGFAVVLMTPDDEGGRVGGPQQRRARQNVVFELGFFIGVLGPDRVATLVKGHVEHPSDYDGVVYISLDDNGWKVALGKELEAAGFSIDWNLVMRA